MVQQPRPTFDQDFWSDDVILNPYPYYQRMRDTGPAVWLTQHNAWAITRYDEVRQALLNGEVFSSAHGCTMNNATNDAMQGTMLCSDDPRHRDLRRVFSRPLTTNALAPLKARLAALAEERIDELIDRGTFDAVVDLAYFLPLTVVTHLVGLSEEGKRNMLDWGAATFDAFGPDTHDRTLSGIDLLKGAFVYLESVKREDLDPDGWGAALFAAADRGELEYRSAKSMLLDYLSPSLDTTINGAGSAIWLFGRFPDQWRKLVANPALIPDAIDEVLRYESPIRAFSRYVTRDCDLGGVPIREGSRALMMYACANRDERKFSNPDVFDIERAPRDHLAFGFGSHMCAGMHLAKLEITTLLEILIRRVKSFEIVAAQHKLNNTLRGLAQLDVTVQAA